MSKTKRYLIFERPLGSKCWTVVMQKSSNHGQYVPVQCWTELAAKQYINQWKQMADDIEYRIVSVELPA